MTGEVDEDDDKLKPGEGDDSVADEVKAALGELTTLVTGVSKRFDGLEERVNSLGTSSDEDDDDDDDEDVDADIEGMSRKDFGQHIVNRVVSQLRKEVLKPVESRVTDAEQRMENDRIGKLVEKASEKYEDFWEFKDEIMAEVKKNAYLEPEEAYHLARSKHPDKVKTLAEKKANGDEESDKKAKGGKFGGLTPTSGKTHQNKKMGRKEAANKAWEDTMGDFPSAGEG